MPIPNIAPLTYNQGRITMLHNENYETGLIQKLDVFSGYHHKITTIVKPLIIHVR